MRTVNGRTVIEYEDMGPRSADVRSERVAAGNTPQGQRLGDAIYPLGSDTGSSRVGRPRGSRIKHTDQGET